MEARTEKLTKGKKEEKTYSADVVRVHIHMYAQMVHLTDSWSTIMSSDVSEVFVETMKKIRKEFLNEFKDDEFYYYLNKMENTLIEFIRKELRH